MVDLILLAAGLGTRLASLGADVPKVLLTLPGGRTLLGENVHNALASGVVDCAVVVTGHRAGLIDAEIEVHEHAACIQTLRNPDFASHGPVRSVWAARDVIASRDFMIGNGDTYYRTDAFRALGAREEPGVFLGYSRRAAESDDVRLQLRHDGSVAAVGKRLPLETADGVSAGLLLVRGVEARNEFSAHLARVVAEEEAHGGRMIWHDLVNEMAATAGRVLTVELDEAWWREVDTPEDHDALQALLTLSR
jgi:choline kinase